VNIGLRRPPNDDEIEAICSAAEEAARKLILSRISLKRVEDLNLSVEAVGDKPLSLNIEISLDTNLEDPNLDRIVDEATDAAFAGAEAKIRELDLCEVSSD
jgi:hypothetical protein